MVIISVEEAVSKAPRFICSRNWLIEHTCAAIETSQQRPPFYSKIMAKGCSPRVRFMEVPMSAQNTCSEHFTLLY